MAETTKTEPVRKIHLSPPRVAVTQNAAVNASVKPATAVNIDAIRGQLDSLLTETRDTVSLAKECVRIAGGIQGVVAVAYFTSNSAGAMRVAASNWSGFVFDRDAFRAGLLKVCVKASTSQQRQTFCLADTKNLATVCIPVSAMNTGADVLAVSVASEPEQLSAFDFTAIDFIASSLKLWHAQQNARLRDAEFQGLAALLELVGRIEQAPTATHACHVIVNELRDFLGCHRIALGLSSATRVGCRLTTLSGMARFDQYSDVARQYQSACDESAIRETLAVWPALNPMAEHTSIALRQLAENQNVEATIGLPLVSQDHLIGVLIFAGSKTSLLDSQTINLLQTSSTVLGGALRQSLRLEGNWLVRSWRKLMATRWTTRIVATTIIAAAATLLCMPWPYQMKVGCTLEPTTRRIVSAPYNGLLEVSLTEPGSVVQRGQILARMDAREIRWELSTVTAERSQALKEFDTELARENIAKAQLARMESERLQKKLDMLQYREQNHELASPIEGMVLNGSLEKLTGAPVTTGQPLFEIAELNPLRLELAVPAEDYFHLKSGQAVTVVFDGFDGETFTGTVERVRPRSEVREGKNVFVAEMEVANPEFKLRPGIQGYAKITGEQHSVAWNMFHKAWEALWRTDPTAILAETTTVGQQNVAAVARSRALRPSDSLRPGSEDTQLADRTLLEEKELESQLPVTKPATRITEVIDPQRRVE